MLEDIDCNYCDREGFPDNRYTYLYDHEGHLNYSAKKEDLTEQIAKDCDG